MTKQRPFLDIVNVKSTLIGGLTTFIIGLVSCIIISEQVSSMLGENFAFVLIVVWGIIALFLWGYLFNKFGGE